MLLRLAKYNLAVKYVGSADVPIADTLSRPIHPDSDPAVKGLDVTIAQVMKVSATRLEILQRATQDDTAMLELITNIKSGWPESMQDLPEHLHSYWCFRDEMAIMDGLVMKG